MIYIEMLEKEDVINEDFSWSSLCSFDWENVDKFFVAYDLQGNKKILGFIQLNKDESYKIDFRTGFADVKSHLIGKAFYFLESEQLKKRHCKNCKKQKLSWMKKSWFKLCTNTNRRQNHQLHYQQPS